MYYINASIFNQDTIDKLKEDIGEEVAIDFIRRYMETSIEIKKDIEKSVNNKNIEELEGHVHKLASSSATFGGERLSKICRKIEDLCIDGKQSEAFGLTNDLYSLLERTSIDLSKFTS